MTNESQKPPVWFWIVAVIALIWNAMGVMAYLAQAYMPVEVFEALSEAEQELYTSRPAWATAAFAIGVFGGALASVFLLLRKKVAHMLFIVSLAGVLIQDLHTFIISNTMDVMGSQTVFLPALVLIIGIGLIFLAKKGKANGWLK